MRFSFNFMRPLSAPTGGYLIELCIDWINVMGSSELREGEQVSPEMMCVFVFFPHFHIFPPAICFHFPQNVC